MIVFLVSVLAAALAATAGFCDTTHRPPAPQGRAIHDRASWLRWTREKDVRLKSDPTSYLKLKQSLVLGGSEANGRTAYLPLDLAAAYAYWTPAEPKGPRLKVDVTDRRALVTSVAPPPAAAAGEAPVDLLAVPSWVVPKLGLRLRALRVPDNAAINLQTFDENNDARVAFKATPYYPYSADAVVTARFEPMSSPQITVFQQTKGTTTQLLMLGHFSFTYKGRAITVAAYGVTPEARALMLAFRDATSGAGTYAGGRFLDVDRGPANPTKPDDQTTLDFNYAYNPLCARNHAYNCLRPPGAALPVAITAGEKAP